MTGAEQKTIVVAGATGRQGGAVARHLLAEGWQVCGLTRNAQSEKARALAALGVTVVQADMDDLGSLKPAIAGAYGVYSVQNPYIAGPEAEVRQGKNLALEASAAGVQHLVYGSAGTGQKGTGVPSWETKLEVERYMRELNLPLTILRPTAFMELMTDKGFCPSMAVWQVMPSVVGPERKLPWLCVDDLGAIAAKAFACPDDFVGKDLKLASDLRSIDECRSLHRTVTGRRPRRFPIPPALFQRFGFVGKDLTAMWRWLHTGTVEADVEGTRAVLPAALTVEEWLRRQKGRRAEQVW